MKMKKFIKNNLLTMATLLGVIAGVTLGLILKSVGDGVWSSRDVSYVRYPGKLFLNMLKCVIIPLVVPSLISSIGSLDLRLSGKIGIRSVVYYMTTTFLAVSLGIILTVTIRPGVGSTETNLGEKETGRNSTTVDTLSDLIFNCFPPNLVQATMQQYRTELVYPGNLAIEDPGTGALLDPEDKFTWRTKSSWTKSTNILGLVVFSVVMGVAVSLAGEEGKPLLAFFKSLSHVMMIITRWIVHFAPVGVCSLMAAEILHMMSAIEELTKLGWYFLTVVLGIFIQGAVILPIIYTVITRKLPFRFISNMGPALATGFGTCSSSAALPVTINNLEQGNNVDKRIARFVLPIGATINMDGTALYEAVAAIFIAQMVGANPGFGELVIISITATAASIGAAGIPHAGLVTLVMVLETIEIPSEAASLIMSLDCLIDRFRTTVNVLGDSFGAAIVAHLSEDELDIGSTTEMEVLEGGKLEKLALVEGINEDNEDSSIEILKKKELTFTAMSTRADTCCGEM